ncbi:MAG: glycosyltransferase family 2 protein [Planctomycetes bacterium]|nr:glycosyltransferase family 2 protein [Planctomycetota bacterium]
MNDNRRDLEDGGAMPEIETLERDARTDAGKPTAITVVIPAFNEEDAVAAEVRHLNDVLGKSGLRYEIIVVDDGSADATAERAEAEDCRLIRQPRNMGYGAALKRGFREARSELVVITDADGTYPAEEIPTLVAEAGSYDMVVGARIGDNVHIPLERRPAKWFLRVLASYLAGFKIPDLNSGLRVIRRAHVRRFAHILPNGFSFTTTITLALLCNDMSVGYHPIDYKKRIGNSKIRPSHAYRFLLLILRVMMLFNPLKIFLPLGAVVGAVGVAKLIYDIRLRNLSESAVMCLIAALLIWCVGLLADQNSRLGMDRETWD